MMDCWSILEIELTNDITAIKRAYAKQLRKYHPEDDLQGFQRVREAYEIAIKKAKILKKSTPIMKQQESNEDIESKVIVRDTYINDLKNIQKDLNLDEQKKKDNNIEDQCDYRTNPKLEPIDNFTKVMNEIEFMDKVKALYNDQSVRNDRDHWKALLGELVFCTIDTSENIYSLLYNFLQENYNISYEILILLNDYFRWAKTPEGLADIFFEENEPLALARSQQDITSTRRVIRILYNKAEYLRNNLLKSDQAIRVYTQIIEHAKANIDLDIDRCLGHALYNKAEILVQIQSYHYARIAYDKLIKDYEDHQDIEMKRLVANAFFKKADLLIHECKYGEALYIYAKLINKYLEDTDEEITYLVACAWYNKAMHLRSLGRYFEGFCTLKDLVETYSFHKNEEVRAIAKKARLKIKYKLFIMLAVKGIVLAFVFLFLCDKYNPKIAAMCCTIFIIIMIIVKICRVYRKHKYTGTVLLVPNFTF